MSCHQVSLQMVTKAITQNQTSQIRWKDHSLQQHIEILSEGQVLQGTGPHDTVQLLVEIFSHGQTPQSFWQFHKVQTAVELRTKGQVLEMSGKGHITHAPVEAIT